eukprot:Plantae.Rhodophyta-Palmaria_palmata.ctg7586.p1 GENE.Plantae.Rhodophyta-Palmaria_palmata.ctg7586~~Plantae.Rhodophyta-Palmaria_palmata.ctg7586.p1  ORF type:complete len:183 (+),score=19.96 Plantae.Rhodophyta-Palmaria_palmata.ctg7586:102-650(+)
MTSDELSVMRMPKFEDKKGEDFKLWSIRMESNFIVEGCVSVVKKFNGAEVQTEDVNQRQITAKKDKAYCMLVNALGNGPLRAAMAGGTKDPANMWDNLQSWYASTTETAHITLASKLANKFLAAGGNVNDYGAELKEIYEGLEACGEKVSEKSKISKIITSFLPECESVCAALRTTNDPTRT